MPTVTCPNCSRSLDSDARHCVYCGAELALSDARTVLSDPGAGAAELALSDARTVLSEPGAGGEITGSDSMLSTLREAIQGRYEIDATLGQGGMGAVFRAKDLVLDCPVAIKVMLPESGFDAGGVERFRQEARTIAGLRHPNIVKVHDLREHRGLHFFILDFIPGLSLDKIIAQSGALPVLVIRLWLSQVASALDLAHRRDVIHRDIKPANILIDTDGHAVLTDFGIAKLQVNPKWKTVTGGFLGTPQYASPEQWKGQAVTPASDQYALGIVAYAMLAGSPPFDGESISDLLLAHTGEAPEPLGRLRPDCPPDLAGAVHRMLEKEPADRWPSMREVMSTLGPVAPPDDPVWSRAATLASGQQPEVGPAIETFETPPPDRGPRSFTATISTWVKPRRKRVAFGSAALIGAIIALAIPWPGAPRGSVLLDPSALTLALGDSASVRATVLSAEGDTMPLGVEWISGDATVATVTPDGRVVALGEGVTTITAQVGPMQATIGISVEGAAIARDSSSPMDRPSDEGSTDPVTRAAAVRLGLAETSVRVGDTIHPTVTLLDEGNRPIDAAQAPTFSADDERVARVVAGGWLVAVGSGTTQIVARADGLEARAGVSVAPVVPLFSSVSAGDEHTCGVASDGMVFCWGKNDGGRVAPDLGERQLVPFPWRTGFRQVSAGGEHTCALGRNGSVACWGGLATPSDRFRTLTAGFGHACGITGEGMTACWGANDRGQLGDGTTMPRAASAGVQGDYVFEMVAAGDAHTCGLLDGRVFCWGSDARGQTGTGTLEPGYVTRPTEVEGDHGYLTFVTAGTHYTCVLTRVRTALCWGANEYGQLGDGSTQVRQAPRPVRPAMGGSVVLTFEMLSAGENHTCGVARTKRVYCWGDNRFGQLGDGTTTRRVVPVRVAADESFVAVSAGGSHTCAVTELGETLCWGANSGGQLGDGTDQQRSQPVTPGQRSSGGP